jgi:hypothetical protein
MSETEPDATIDYEATVARFTDSLLTNLRGHGAEAACLEGWVPDADPVRSLLNMVETAELAGEASITIRFAAATLDPAGRDTLLAAVSDLGQARLDTVEGGFRLRVEGLGGL